MRLMKIAVLTGLLTLSGLAQANAAAVWHQVTINFAGGTDTGRVYVNLTGAGPSTGLFAKVWCFNDSVTHTKLILAAALTAVSANSQLVYALLTDPDTGVCIVNSVLAGE